MAAATTTTTVVEELPLIRSKCEGIGNTTGTNVNVGPCTYDVADSSWDGKNNNNSRAPFNTTSHRPPLSLNDPGIPGPGRYDLTEPEDNKIGVVSIPFVSGSTRFQTIWEEDAPGPGAYNNHGKWPHKPSCRSHKFSDMSPDGFAGTYNGGATMGPGYYNPNLAAASRSNPKASHFSKYCPRTYPHPNGNPGPGTYDLDRKPHSLYAQKPSSMFATNTSRGQHSVKDTPGPGDYEIAGSMIRKTPARSLGRAAFGTSSPRFDGPGLGDTPGPGWYTGEVALRRPKYNGPINAHPFLSTEDRFKDDSAFGPEPGLYDPTRPPKHMYFGGGTPFGSTVPRFTATVVQDPLLTFDEAFGPAYYGRSGPRRTKPMRQFIHGNIKPTTGPEQLPERFYDVKYDWPKPTSLHGLFGAASRGSLSAADNGVPGPGSYRADGTINSGRGNSTWAKDVRFAPAGMERGGTIGPGRYHHESTFLRKSFNCTIGSDLTW